MGLNPLIAARSYIFHVFFILPRDSEIKILFLIHRLCVFVFFSVSSCLSVLKISPSTTKCLLFGEPAATVSSAGASGQQGAVVCLFLLHVKTLICCCCCCCFCIQYHWQHTGPTAQWVMNELPFITVNQWAKPINCQARDEFVFVRMTDCSTVQMFQAAAGSREKSAFDSVSSEVKTKPVDTAGCTVFIFVVSSDVGIL